LIFIVDSFEEIMGIFQRNTNPFFSFFFFLLFYEAFLAAGRLVGRLFSTKSCEFSQKIIFFTFPTLVMKIQGNRIGLV